MIDVSLMYTFPMLVSVGRGIGKTEFTKKLIKSKLIAPLHERTAWCYVKYQQGLFEKLMKMNVKYVGGIPEELEKYFKKNKRNLFILDNVIDKALKS